MIYYNFVLKITTTTGTLSMLLSKRHSDKSKGGFKHWPFTSVHFWGEQPKGTWILVVRDRVSS